MPNIFISYRRSDSEIMTGRIYDRLIAAFGKKNIFKDMENIPAGADFRAVLREAINSCEVMLVIMGSEWATILDKEGKPRLDDPDDFVRVEVETALRLPHITVIPVLINNATMPTEEQLPVSLHELMYRNAAVVRKDPDFNTDMDRLRQRLRKPRSWGRQIVVALMALVLIGILGGFALSQLKTANTNNDSPADIQVEPIAAGEYMILVAEIEQVGATARDVQRFIVRDLTEWLEEDAIFSNLRVRSYPTIIADAVQARSVAEQYGASVVIFGTYTDQFVDVELQMGKDAGLLPRAELERTINTTLRLSDEQTETLAYAVLSHLIAQHSLNGDVFEAYRVSGMMNLLNVPAAEPRGSGIAATLHRAQLLYFQNQPTAAVEEITAAIEMNSQSSLLYYMRGLIRMREGDIRGSEEDFNAARSLLPGWTTPDYVQGVQTFLYKPGTGAAIPYLDRVIATHPEDWSAYYWRGSEYYMQQDFALARADFEQALSHNPEMNVPHAIAAAIALREGRIADAQALLNQSAQFPNFSLTELIIQIGVPDTATQPLALIATVNAATRLALRQWSEVIRITEPLVSIQAKLDALYFMQGIAYCNLDQYAAAEATYTQGIELFPDYYLLYLLRAEVRLYQNKLAGSIEDIQVVESSPQAATLSPIIEMGQAGAASCKTLFDVASN